ncbi:MAG: HNH endonuclease signature motif containing protein [Vicinamibacterales bacterium]
MTTIDSFNHFSDEQLIACVPTHVGDERRAMVALIASLVEFDARKLYLRLGCSSLFTYCTQVLHLSEHAAYGRIEAARAARRIPVVLDQLACGAINLTTICLLSPHLTGDNYADVLAAAQHKSKREVELLVATLRPLPPVSATIRQVPTRTSVESSSAVNTGQDLFDANESTPRSGEASRPAAAVTPLAPERYKLQVTLSAEGHNHLRRAQDLLRHSIPSGDLGTIVERALTLLVRELEKTKFAATARPVMVRAINTRSRHIPAGVRRRVWQRDGGRCAFMGTEGRCAERGLLEFHHVVPYADGGESVVENLELRCRAHNVYEAGRWDGTLFAREASVGFDGPGLDRVPCSAAG